MKKIFLAVLTFSIFCSIQAQNVGINSTGATPDASALLDIVASDKGLLIPRVTLTGTTDVTTITSAATSLLIYNSATVSDVTSGYYYWDGSVWVRFLNTVGSSNDWRITGNSGTTAGTNFIGTTDAVDWVIKTNNTEKARVTSGGNVGIGTATPSNKMHIYEATNNASRSLVYSESNDPGSGGTISNVAIMGKAIGSGSATDKYVGVLGYTDGGGFGSWRAHGVMGVVGDNAAADGTTYNPYDAPVNSTASGITGYSTGNILVQNTAGYFLNDGTGFSTHKGIQIQNYGTNATRYGIYLEVEDAGSSTTSSSQFGLKMSVREGTSKNYGTRLDLDGNTNSTNWGEYFNITGTGTGISYGAQYEMSGGATNYGAYYDVSSGTNSYGIYVRTTGGTNEYAIYADASASTDYAGYFNNGKVYVKDQLTIGTTTPNEKLTVQGAISIDESSAPSATAGYGKLYVKSTTSDLYFKDDGGVEYNLLTSGASAWTDGGTSIYPTTLTDKVGIGTTTPTQALDVVGDIAVDGVGIITAGGNDPYINVRVLQNRSTTMQDGMYINFNSTGANNPIKFYTPGTTERMRITNNGYVGIGVTAPTARLCISNSGASLAGTARSTTLNTMAGALSATVNTDLNLASFGYTSANATSLGVHAFRRVAGGAWSNTNIIIGMDVDNSTRAGAWVSMGGNARVGILTANPDQTFSVNGGASKTGGGTWAAFSDKRVKKDIKDFNDGLSIINQIEPVSFKYNGLGGNKADGKEYVGIIAQDIQEIAPYMIETISKKLKESDKESTDLLMYDASALTYILVNAIKELNKKIEILEKENEGINELKTEIENIKSILNTTAKK